MSLYLYPKKQPANQNTVLYKYFILIEWFGSTSTKIVLESFIRVGPDK